MRSRDYKLVASKIHELAYRKRFPVRTMFELTYRCNFDCVHCYVADIRKKSTRKDELNRRQVLNILEQLRDLGCLYLGFTGGEIFLREDLLDIVKFACRLGFNVVLLTNASLIDEDAANELAKFLLNKVDITIHAMDKNIFDKITKVKGSADRVFKALGLLYERGIALELKSCGMQDNKDEIVKINKFAKDLNVRYRLDCELFSCSGISNDPSDYALSLNEVRNLRRICYPEMFDRRGKDGRFRKRIRFKRSLSRIFNCGAGYTDLTINPFGELKLCLEIDHPRYKVLEGCLKDGWQNIKDFVDNLKPPDKWNCLNCDLIEYCSWCPAIGYLEDGSFFTCPSYIRERALFARNMSLRKE